MRVERGAVAALAAGLRRALLRVLALVDVVVAVAIWTMVSSVNHSRGARRVFVYVPFWLPPCGGEHMFVTRSREIVTARSYQPVKRLLSGHFWPRSLYHTEHAFGLSRKPAASRVHPWPYHRTGWPKQTRCVAGRFSGVLAAARGGRAGGRRGGRGSGPLQPQRRALE